MHEQAAYSQWTPLLHKGLWEPFQLRELKKKLANIKCSCAFCERSRLQKHPVGDPKKDPEVTDSDKCSVEDPKKDLEVTKIYPVVPVGDQRKDVEVIRKHPVGDPKKDVEVTESYHVKNPFKLVKYPVGDPTKDLEVTDNEQQFDGVQWIDSPQKYGETQSIESSRSVQHAEELQLIDTSNNQLNNISKLEELESDNNSKPAVVLVSTETITDNFLFPSQLPKQLPFLQRDQNHLCPSCYFSIDLLKSSKTKVLKDEESETKPDMYTCDKSTSQNIISLEKSTSYNKPLLKYPQSSVSDDSLNAQNSSFARREVTFACNNNQYYDHARSYKHRPGNIDISSSDSSEPLHSDNGHFEQVEEEEETSTMLEANAEINNSPPPEHWVASEIQNLVNSITPPHERYFSFHNYNYEY